MRQKLETARGDEARILTGAQFHPPPAEIDLLLDAR
jgi:hypothetical protein